MILTNDFLEHVKCHVADMDAVPLQLPLKK